jgi:hypothetical protein
MALILHIIIALASVAFTTFLYVKPSKPGLNISYALVILTVVSGSYLIVSQPAHMVQACVSGLTYVGVMTVGLLAVHRKMALELDKSK